MLHTIPTSSISACQCAHTRWKWHSRERVVSHGSQRLAQGLPLISGSFISATETPQGFEPVTSPSQSNFTVPQAAIFYCWLLSIEVKGQWLVQDHWKAKHLKVSADCAINNCERLVMESLVCQSSIAVRVHQKLAWCLCDQRQRAEKFRQLDCCYVCQWTGTDGWQIYDACLPA